MIDLNKYELIVREFSLPIYKYCCFRLAGDENLAEEVTADVFRILFERWDQIDTGDRLRAYLYRAADNCIRQNIEKNQRFWSRIQSIHELPEDSVIHFDEYFADDEAEKYYINKIRNSLPEEWREIFILRFIRKLTITEISESVGIPYSSLRLRLDKIEKAVRAEIRKNF